MIEFKNVEKSYDGTTTAVSNLSFIAPTGKITVLVGPSGCGKTTTLRMINRLIEPTSGSILLDGEDNTEINTIEMRRKIGYVIQNAGLFPHHTVIDNVCAVPFLHRGDKKKTRERAMQLLDLVGLDASYAKRYPWELSGGQQQRVGVARALAADPPFMLMDEPFSAVDPIVRAQLQSEFLQIQRDLAKTIVLVTHDINEALRLGDQIVVLKEGGILAQVGTPAEILANPADEFVANFLGDSRGYYALGFESVRGIPFTQTQSLTIDDPAPRTEEIWVVATDANDHPLGWVQPDEIDAQVTAADVSTASTVSLADGNHRELLDAALASPNGKAIVVNEDNTYAGTIDLDEVVKHSLHSLDAERADAEHADQPQAEQQANTRRADHIEGVRGE